MNLNLLTAFDILLQERSVMGAARRLDLCTSAMRRTHPTSRRGRALGDPVLAPVGRAMVPMSHAKAIAEQVA